MTSQPLPSDGLHKTAAAAPKVTSFVAEPAPTIVLSSRATTTADVVDPAGDHNHPLYPLRRLAHFVLFCTFQPDDEIVCKLRKTLVCVLSLVFALAVIPLLAAVVLGLRGSNVASTWAAVLPPMAFTVTGVITCVVYVRVRVFGLDVSDAAAGWLCASLSCAAIIDALVASPGISIVVPVYLAIFTLSIDVPMKIGFIALHFTLVFYHALNWYLAGSLSAVASAPTIDTPIVVPIATALVFVYQNFVNGEHTFAIAKLTTTIRASQDASNMALSVSLKLADYDTDAVSDLLFAYRQTEDHDPALLTALVRLNTNLKEYRSHLPKFVVRNATQPIRCFEGNFVEVDTAPTTTEAASTTSLLQPSSTTRDLLRMYGNNSLTLTDRSMANTVVGSTPATFPAISVIQPAELQERSAQEKHGVAPNENGSPILVLHSGLSLQNLFVAVEGGDESSLVGSRRGSAMVLPSTAYRGTITAARFLVTRRQPMQAPTDAEVQGAYDRIVRAICRAAEEYGGAVHGFFGDAFTCSWNATERCADPEVMAAKFAWKLLRLIDDIEYSGPAGADAEVAQMHSPTDRGQKNVEGSRRSTSGSTGRGAVHDDAALRTAFLTSPSPRRWFNCVASVTTGTGVAFYAGDGAHKSFMLLGPPLDRQREMMMRALRMASSWKDGVRPDGAPWRSQFDSPLVLMDAMTNGGTKLRTLSRAVVVLPAGAEEPESAGLLSTPDSPDYLVLPRLVYSLRDVLPDDLSKGDFDQLISTTMHDRVTQAMLSHVRGDDAAAAGHLMSTPYSDDPDVRDLKRAINAACGTTCNE